MCVLVFNAKNAKFYAKDAEKSEVLRKQRKVQFSF